MSICWRHVFFVLFNNSLRIHQFIQQLNNQHSCMKSPLESERNISIVFLYVNIVKLNDRFATYLYREPTFTGFGCKYDSAITLITCSIDRAYKISSTYQTFCSELEQLRKYFLKTNIRLKSSKIPFATSWTVSSLLLLPCLQSPNKSFT